MSEARKQVLQMLQEGKITADQAADLLAALESADDETVIVYDEPPTLTGDVVHNEPPPDMARFRRFWQTPFFIALAALIVLGLWLRSLYQTSEGAITLGFVCLWSLFMLAFGLTVLAFMSRRSAWLHVRVRPQDGPRIAISLPLPLRLANWGIRIAESFAPDSARGNLQMADQFVRAAQENWEETRAEPITISVDDDDGDQVQIYIG